MQYLKNFAAFILTIVLVGLSLQSVQAQKLPIGHKKGFTPKVDKTKLPPTTLKPPKVILGKDLIITNAKLVSDGKKVEGKYPCKVEFTVKNIGTSDVTEEAPVLMYMLRYTLAGTHSQPMFSELVHRQNGRSTPFKTGPIKSGETKSYTAHVKYGLLAGYGYRIEIAVDATREGRGVIQEANETNNDFEMPLIKLK